MYIPVYAYVTNRQTHSEGLEEDRQALCHLGEEVLLDLPVSRLIQPVPNHLPQLVREF